MKSSNHLLKTLALAAVAILIGACDQVSSSVSSSFSSDSSSSIKSSSSISVSSSSLEAVDYVDQLKLDMTSTTKKAEVTVRTFIDGDTTHFNIPVSAHYDDDSEILKARYLAINTPESTGKIEAWGKKASNFTHSKLESAVAIMVESDDENWNIDSTGSRCLVWVWYKPSAEADYRNLNLEILQNGLALASSTANNRYGTVCMNALNQAKAQKLNIYSGKKDPDFYYGAVKQVTIRELRLNISKYDGVKVAFDGVVVRDYNSGVYVEDFDSETGIYFGMYVYYGASASGFVTEMLVKGNKCHIVGTLSSFNGSYQVSGITHSVMDGNVPGNTYLISSDNEISYQNIEASEFFENREVKVIEETGEGEEAQEQEVTYTKKFAELALNASVSMNNLYVSSIYTTSNEDSSSKGAMTLSCTCGGVNITVRTIVLRDSSNNLVTASAYEHKTINVKGVIDYYDGYQIKVLSASDIVVVE